MTYVEENTKKLEGLKKLPYEELRRMEKEILNNPNSTRADIINICVARGEKGIELILTKLLQHHLTTNKNTKY